MPVTGKIRLGWDQESKNYKTVAKVLEDNGASLVAVHGRTRCMAYGGHADWSAIAEIKQLVKIPVLGNGDVKTPEDIAAIKAQTGCDAVMIGRAAPSNPWIFRQMSEYSRTGAYSSPGEQDRYELIRDYYAMLVEEDTPGALGKMKQFASWFTHGVRDGAALRRSVQSATDVRQVLERVDTFFNRDSAVVNCAV